MDKNIVRTPIPQNTCQLPENAPLGGAYVPFQLPGATQYKHDEALKNGTLYEALNLPYLDMVNTETLPKTLETELSALLFVINDLGLYLDTHPDDTEAIALHNLYVKTVGELVNIYEKQFGPINQFAEMPDKRYSWIDDPWPWDNSRMKEMK